MKACLRIRLKDGSLSKALSLCDQKGEEHIYRYRCFALESKYVKTPGGKDIIDYNYFECIEPLSPFNDPPLPTIPQDIIQMATIVDHICDKRNFVPEGFYNFNFVRALVKADLANGRLVQRIEIGSIFVDELLNGLAKIRQNAIKPATYLEPVPAQEK
jgi:hypothetical protein